MPRKTAARFGGDACDGSSAWGRLLDSFQQLPGVLLALPGANPALLVPGRRDVPPTVAVIETVYRQNPRAMTMTTAARSHDRQNHRESVGEWAASIEGKVLPLSFVVRNSTQSARLARKELLAPETEFEEGLDAGLPIGSCGWIVQDLQLDLLGEWRGPNLAPIVEEQCPPHQGELGIGRELRNRRAPSFRPFFQPLAQLIDVFQRLVSTLRQAQKDHEGGTAAEELDVLSGQEPAFAVAQ